MKTSQRSSRDFAVPSVWAACAVVLLGFWLIHGSIPAAVGLIAFIAALGSLWLAD